MLQRLRSSRLRGLILLGYALMVVAGMLSSVYSSGEFQVVCLGNGGMKMVIVDSNGDPETESTTTTAVCPLAHALAPVDFVPTLGTTLSPLEYATRPAVVARLIALAGAPLPPRGPPLA